MTLPRPKYVIKHVITPEGYRQKFRNLGSKKLSLCGVCHRKNVTIQKWLEVLTIATYAEIMNAIVLEEWKSKIPFPDFKYVSNEKELLKVSEMVVYLECPLFKSIVKVAVKHGKLPVQGVQLLLLEMT